MMMMMTTMPSSSRRRVPVEREKVKEPTPSLCVENVNVMSTILLSRTTHLVAFTHHHQRKGGGQGELCPPLLLSSSRLRAARGAERARAASLNSILRVFSIGAKRCRHRMRVVLVLVALAISGRSSTKKKSQSTNDEKRGNECVPNGKERRRIPEEFARNRRKKRRRKRGTRKSGRLARTGGFPELLKNSNDEVFNVNVMVKNKGSGSFERNRDVNHSGYRRERKLGQSRQVSTANGALLLSNCQRLYPKMQKFPMEWAVQPFDDPYADPLDLDMILDGEYVTEMVPGNFQFLKKGRAVGPGA